MPSPPPVNRRPSFIDDNYDEPEGEDFPRKVSGSVVGRLVTRANSRAEQSNPPPFLPPKRLSERNTETKEKAPSVRAQTMPRPINTFHPNLPSKPVKAQSNDDGEEETEERNTEKKEKAPSVRAQTMPLNLPSKPVKVHANNDDDGEGGQMFLPPTLNPITVAKMNKLRGVNQNQKMPGNELFKRRQELQKAFQN